MSRSVVSLDDIRVPPPIWPPRLLGLPVDFARLFGPTQRAIAPHRVNLTVDDCGIANIRPRGAFLFRRPFINLRPPISQPATRCRIASEWRRAASAAVRHLAVARPDRALPRWPAGFAGVARAGRGRRRSPAGDDRRGRGSSLGVVDDDPALVHVVRASIERSKATTSASPRLPPPPEAPPTSRHGERPPLGADQASSIQRPSIASHVRAHGVAAL